MAASSSSIGYEMIPEDIVFQILLWLPVASLLRFKSVCKCWLSRIQSSTFISQHAHRSNSEDNQENKLIMVNFNQVCSHIFTHKLISVFDLQLSRRADFKVNTDENVFKAKLIGSFNGIICLAHQMLICEDIEFGSDVGGAASVTFVNVVSLWNPATKHARILPPPLLDNRLVPDLQTCRINYGFGFDVKTNDYRVVRVIVGKFACGNKMLKSHAEVYCLDMDFWRVIDDVVPSQISIKSNPKRPSPNGTCYWLGWDVISKYPVILSFEFSNEVFGIIPVNDVFGTTPVLDDYEGFQILDFLKEKLACIHMVPDSSEGGVSHCKVWVLDKCGVNESWTKLYTIMLEPQVLPKGFSADGKMVLKKRDDSSEANLILFDLATQEFNDTSSKKEFNDTSSQRKYSQVAVYKESLVSIEGATSETYMVDSKWKTFSSMWDLTVSQVILSSNEKFAGILDQHASSLIVFDEPKRVPHLPAQTILATCWSPPLAGTIKLNTGAIWKSSSKLGTFGWVARNAAGIAVKAACANPFPVLSVLTGQAEAVMDALYGAVNAGWDSIIVESDCKPLVDMINGSSDLDPSVSYIVADINILRSHFETISFCFVARALNTAAHTLACHGFMCEMLCTWDTIMPDWLNYVLDKELVY